MYKKTISYSKNLKFGMMRGLIAQLMKKVRKQ